MGAKKVPAGLPSRTQGRTAETTSRVQVKSLQEFVNSIDGVKINTDLTPIFTELNVMSIDDLSELTTDMVDSKVLPQLKKLEQKKWTKGDVLGKTKEYVNAMLGGIEANASNVKTIKAWLALLPATVKENAEKWLVEYGIEDFDDGLDDIVGMEKDDLVQLMNVMNNCKANMRRHAHAALKGLSDGVKLVVEEEVKRKEEEERKREEAILVKKIPEVKEKYKEMYNPPFTEAAHDGNVENVRIL